MTNYLSILIAICAISAIGITLNELHSSTTTINDIKNTYNSQPIEYGNSIDNPLPARTEDQNVSIAGVTIPYLGGILNTISSITGLIWYVLTSINDIIGNTLDLVKILPSWAQAGVGAMVLLAILCLYKLLSPASG